MVCRADFQAQSARLRRLRSGPRKTPVWRHRGRRSALAPVYIEYGPSGEAVLQQELHGVGHVVGPTRAPGRQVAPDPLEESPS